MNAVGEPIGTAEMVTILQNAGLAGRGRIDLMMVLERQLCLDQGVTVGGVKVKSFRVAGGYTRVDSEKFLDAVVRAKARKLR